MKFFITSNSNNQIATLRIVTIEKFELTFLHSSKYGTFYVFMFPYNLCICNFSEMGGALVTSGGISEFAVLSNSVGVFTEFILISGFNHNALIVTPTPFIGLFP